MMRAVVADMDHELPERHGMISLGMEGPPGTVARDASASRLVIDGLIEGDLRMKIHVVLAQTSIVPTPDNETIEQVADGGAGPYGGVSISIASRPQAPADGARTGAISGSMRRLS